MTIEQAREQMTLWVGYRDTAREKRDHYARLVEGYQRMVDGLELIYPELSNAEPPADTPAADVKNVKVFDLAGGAAAGGGGTGTVEMHPAEQSPTEVPAEARNFSRDLTLLVLTEGHGDWIKTDELVKKMFERGFTSTSQQPEATVRYVLKRLRAEGLVEEGKLDGRTKAWRAIGAPDAETPVAAGAPAVPATGPGGDEEDALPLPLPPDHDHVSLRRNGHRFDPSVVP